MAERLIDEKKLREKLYEWCGNHCHNRSGCKFCDVSEIIDIVEEMPTTEEKPVVYCKDCKYNVANSKHEPLDITDYTDITCEYFMTDGMSPNDYCSQGVKIPVISMEDVPKLMREGD